MSHIWPRHSRIPIQLSLNDKIVHKVYALNDLKSQVSLINSLPSGYCRASGLLLLILHINHSKFLYIGNQLLPYHESVSSRSVSASGVINSNQIAVSSLLMS